MSTSTQASTGLQSRIASCSARVGIIGMGCVGLPLALLFSEQGFSVTGFDVDPAKVDALNEGDSCIVGIPSTEIRSAHRRGFSATADYARSAAMDAILICVPTPLDRFRQPDLRCISAAAQAIAPHLRPAQLIVLESTSWPGATEDLLIPLLESGNPAGLRAESLVEPDAPRFYVAFSPESEDPGNDSVARRDIPRIVGGIGPVSRDLACALYASIFNRVVPVSTPAAAEMTGLLENVCRSVNIALVNELRPLCRRMNIDLFEVIDAAKSRPFGFQAFYPGPCVPIEPLFLSRRAMQFDSHTRLIDLAGEINASMPDYVVENTIEALNLHRKPLKGSRILVLGIACLPGVDGLRESPALTMIGLLRRRGAKVACHDPYFARVGGGRRYDLDSAPLESLAEYDCILIVADHSSCDYLRIVSEARLVIDTCNATRGIVSGNIVRC